MKGICRVKGNGYTPCLPIFFFLCVSHVANTYQSEVILQKDNINYKKSNFSSWVKKTTVDLQAQPHSLPVNIEAGDVCGLNYFCENGGKCAEDRKKLCECKQGTSGELCQNVDDCGRYPGKCGFASNVECIYDLEKEKAVCKCKDQFDLFDEENLRCRTSCKAVYECRYGGKCVNNFCKCLPGTSGDKCHTIDACSTDAKTRKECGDPDNVYCEYNETTQKHYCSCRIINYFYDTYDMSCKECECGPDGNCSFVKGKKTCHCEEGYAVKEVFHWILGMVTRCQACECGEHSDGCEFTDSYTQKCFCHEGYDQGFYRKCSKCDCGPYGKCHFDQYKKICDCDSRFSDNEGTCEECYCGPYGKCNFDERKKICDCDSGFSDNAGTCEECNCYMGRDEINCTFSSGTAHCLCPPGYKQSRSTCVDIDECLNLHACPPNTNCENTPGSYECHCKTGYRPSNQKNVKVYGCQDIDECVEYLLCPFTDTTVCENTPGSYRCVCKSGYLPQSADDAEKYAGCWKDQSTWRLGYVLLLVFYSIISLCLVIAIFRRCRTNNA